MNWTPEQREQAVRDWMERTKLGGKVDMTQTEYNKLANDYYHAPPTSHFGMVIDLQCERNYYDKFANTAMEHICR